MPVRCDRSMTGLPMSEEVSLGAFSQLLQSPVTSPGQRSPRRLSDFGEIAVLLVGPFWLQVHSSLHGYAGMAQIWQVNDRLTNHIGTSILNLQSRSSGCVMQRGPPLARDSSSPRTRIAYFLL